SMSGVAKLLQHLDEGITPVLANLNGATGELDGIMKEAGNRLRMQPGEPLKTLDETLNEYRKLAQQMQGQIGPVMGDARTALNSLDNALDDIEAVATTIQRDVAKNPALLGTATDTLRELKLTASSIRQLADYLARNPNASLTGKR